MTPEHDRYDEDVYKVYVNGAEFARYMQEAWAKRVIQDIKLAIQRTDKGCDYYQLPKEVIV